jgi:WD40 repeat protein
VHAFHPSGRYFASGMDLWAVNEGFSAATLLVTLPSATSVSGILAFHPSGRYLATAEVQINVINGKAESKPYITKLWALKEDCGAATCVLVLPQETERNPYGWLNPCGLHSLRASFHPSGRYLATGHHSLKIWALKDDCSDATPVCVTCVDHITHMAFHPSWLYLVITTHNSYSMCKTFPHTELFAVEADCSEIEVICQSGYSYRF